MKCFVYGTLKSGQCRGHVMKMATALGEASTIQGDFALMNCGSYPALIKASDASFKLEPMVVQGEIYEITPALLKQLDGIEGYPYLYTREEITLDGGEKAIAYLFADPGYFAQKHLIPGGSWDDKMRR